MDIVTVYLLNTLLQLELLGLPLILRTG
jgi:hypothetical protein